MNTRGEIVRDEGKIGWAEDFYRVWHRMSSNAWAKGIGPADPVVCCGSLIDSVHSSEFHPSELADEGRAQVVCAEPIIDKWRTVGCGFCYAEAGRRCFTRGGVEREKSHSRRRIVVFDPPVLEDETGRPNNTTKG